MARLGKLAACIFFNVATVQLGMERICSNDGEK